MNNASDSEKNNQSNDSTNLVVNPCDPNVLLKAVTTTPLPHDQAAARIFVDGLAVFMFNTNKTRAEFGFLAYQHYAVKMKIYKNGCNLVWSTEDWNQFPHHTNNIMITINSGKSTKMGSVYQENTTPMPPEDFRRMPNLAQWHGKTELPVLGDAKTHLSARLNIHDAIFYTYKKSRGDAHRNKKTNPLPMPHNLGKVGRIIGGDIFNSVGETIEIKIKLQDGSIFTVPPLVNNGTDKYTITVRTRAISHIPDHFFLLYKILQLPIGYDEFNLKFVPPEIHWKHCGDAGLFADSHDHHEADKEESDDPYEKDRKRLYLIATEYACQVFGGGCGELPEFP